MGILNLSAHFELTCDLHYFATHERADFALVEAYSRLGHLLSRSS